MSLNYLKSSLAHQEFLTAHLLLFTSNISWFFYLGNRNANIAKQEQNCTVRRDNLGLLAKGKLFWEYRVIPFWKIYLMFMSVCFNHLMYLMIFRRLLLPFRITWLRSTWQYTTARISQTDSFLNKLSKWMMKSSCYKFFAVYLKQNAIIIFIRFIRFFF